MPAWRLTLSILPDLFAVCRLPAAAPLPSWTAAGPFVSITRTRDESSVVCLQSAIPAGVEAEAAWRCLKVEGPFPLEGTVGVLAALTAPLADAGISVLAIGTYDTDYLLLKDASLARAADVLTQAGQQVRAQPEPHQGSAVDPKDAE